MVARVLKLVAGAVLAFSAANLAQPIPGANAELLAKVDLSSQRMKVYVDGRQKYSWRVSTGKRGYRTKTGRFTPYAMKAVFYSEKWKMKLPHTVWVHKNTAIHGTYRTSRLGRTASHGCIRLAPSHAKKFYKLVKRHGMWSTTVVVKK